MSSAAQPANRRSFLGSSLALASAVATSAAAPARAGILADHPDAELLALETAITAALRRQQQFDRETDAAHERYHAPKIPDALFLRPEDRHYICSLPEKCLAEYPRGDTFAPCFENGVADLHGWAQRYAAEGDAYENSVFTSVQRVRVREIKAAHEAWRAAVAEAENKAGITASSAAGDREEGLIEELRRRIALTPASTADGIIVKARAAGLSLAEADDLAWIGREYLPGLLAGWDATNDQGARFRILAVSLVADVLRLGPDPATSGERSVA